MISILISVSEVRAQAAAAAKTQANRSVFFMDITRGEETIPVGQIPHPIAGPGVRCHLRNAHSSTLEES